MMPARLPPEGCFHQHSRAAVTNAAIEMHSCFLLQAPEGRLPAPPGEEAAKEGGKPRRRRRGGGGGRGGGQSAGCQGYDQCRVKPSPSSTQGEDTLLYFLFEKLHENSRESSHSRRRRVLFPEMEYPLWKFRPAIFCSERILSILHLRLIRINAKGQRITVWKKYFSIGFP